MSELFVPAWAEKELKRPKPFDQAELDTLREFYQCWEGLHALPKDKLHRKQAEEAAVKLVQQAHILRRMYV
jgi:hypothetical protein